MRHGVRQSTIYRRVKDVKQPCDEVKLFNSMRAYHVGGNAIMCGRQCLRFGPHDFEVYERDGFGIDWQIRYEDLAPWYDHTEEFVGISGQAEGLPQCPDGVFLPPFEMNCVE